jgi:superfamily II DNA or RNA helicase
LTEGAFSGLSFQGQWRRYQQLAVDAFDRDRVTGRRKTYLVAPPGSGKTLIGVEAARRIGGPAVVLAPNSAVQGQWLAAVQRFAAPQGFAQPEPGAPLSCLTYQSLCQSWMVLSNDAGRRSVR